MKYLKKLGKVLNSKEQKSIKGGVYPNGSNGVVNNFDPLGNGFNFQCDSSIECPNAVNPFTGNYCQGYCFQYATGSECRVDVC